MMEEGERKECRQIYVNFPRISFANARILRLFFHSRRTVKFMHAHNNGLLVQRVGVVGRYKFKFIIRLMKDQLSFLRWSIS